MKKLFLGIVLTVSLGILSGCMITENYDEYKRKQFRSTDEISEIIANDSSTNYSLQVSDTEELLVEYSDSTTESWYDIDVADGVLKIEKTQGTVGVEENSVIITLPKKEYKNISIETSNGNIVFENILAEKYKCFVKNGDITGTLNGNETDYLIVAKVQNGSSNIKDHVIESSKIIEFNVENGNVNVNFSDFDQSSLESLKSDAISKNIRQEIESDNSENKKQAEVSDGVYRTYSFGTTLQEDTVLKIQPDLLFQAVDQPVKTLIYLNGSLYKTVDFSGEEEEIRLDKSGNYWIIVVDAENNYKDITDEIDYYVECDENSILYLQ